MRSFHIIGHDCIADDFNQVKNGVVIWDRIVRRKEDAVIKYSGKNKYMFRDISSSFKYAFSSHFPALQFIFSFRNVPPASYSLKYNVMPYVGLLTFGEAARTTNTIAFPTLQPRI